MKKLQLSTHMPYRMGMLWDPIGEGPAEESSFRLDASLVVSLEVISKVWDGGGRLQEPIQNYMHTWVINQTNRDGVFL